MIDASLPAQARLPFLRCLDGYEQIVQSESNLSKKSVPDRTSVLTHSHPHRSTDGQDLAPMGAAAKAFIVKQLGLDKVQRRKDCVACFPMSVTSAFAAAFVLKSLSISKAMPLEGWASVDVLPFLQFLRFAPETRETETARMGIRERH